MKFSLIGPTNTQTLDIKWIEVQTQQGSFVIKEGHVPMIIALASNKELSMELNDGSTTVMTIVDGILEVTRTSVTLLAYE